VARVRIPAAAGRLEAAAPMYNGPSGLALDEHILAPLGVGRERAWLADLVPHSCVNPQQREALARAYTPNRDTWGLPEPSVPSVPDVLATPARQDELAAELVQSKASILVLLGDEPIRHFAHRWLPKARTLAHFGAEPDRYGHVHEATIAGARVGVLPLAHPRQVARLGRSSERWYRTHRAWVERGAAGIGV
jgi:hypothetical protein